MAHTFPTLCPTPQHWLKSCEYASFYCTTVSLLPTNQPSTNRVVARNRRIGVSVTDVAKWKKEEGVYKVTRYFRQGYNIVKESSAKFNSEAGVPAPIRCTTVCPGGTIPKVPGVISAFYHPNFKYMTRRTRVQENSPFDSILNGSGLPREHDVYSINTVIYEYPIYTGEIKPAGEVSIWEQALNLIWLQKEWADNAVSNTLYFKPKWPKIKIITSDFINEIKQYVETDVIHLGLAKDLIEEGRETYESEEYRFEKYRLVFKYKDPPKWPNGMAKIGLLYSDLLTEIYVHQYNPNHEEDDIEPVLSMIVPHIKSLSLLPHSDKGAYAQMPEEKITREEYEDRVAQLQPIDWSKLNGSDGEDERFCSGASCEINIKQ